VNRPPDPIVWTPLSALAARFTANVAALRGRDADLAERLRSLAPAAEHFIATIGGAVRIGTRATAGEPIAPRPDLLTPAAAAEAATGLYPDGACNVPCMVAGEDLGWLWDRLYRLPCDSKEFFGHRPPLYFLLPDLQRLWVMLHLHDWRAMLADARARLFAGPDAVERFGRCLAAESTYPWPHRWVTVDPSVWPDGVTMDALQLQALKVQKLLYAQVCVPPTPAEAAAVAARLVAAAAEGRPLRVLGLTTRYSVFIQHSMRDWLAAFDALGHATRLLIEPTDHQSCNTLVIATACDEFLPDLALMIGHYRATVPGIPPHVPIAMWVQDQLPHIYKADAGAWQGPLDFCVGSGRQHLVSRYGYPPERFLPAPVGVNDQRFAPGPPTAAERAAFECDLAYVSHNSAPADVVLQRELDRRNSPPADRLFRDMFDRSVAHYQGGGAALLEQGVRAMLRDAMATTGVDCGAKVQTEAVQFFQATIGNALFRHQALRWASDLGVDLRIYGRGWENHPTLARHARGVADNATQLSAIYRASRINLQVIVTGAMHQRMLDGLAAGGFFLLRRCPIDEVGRHYLVLWDWCQRNRVRDEADFRRRADDAVRQACGALDATLGYDMAAADLPLFDILQTSAEQSFMNTATGVWPEYDRVAFADAAELRARLQTYLGDPDARAAVATAMRTPVVERASYRQITLRLLDMIARNVAQPGASRAVAA
jgi:hypothetical protein